MNQAHPIHEPIRLMVELDAEDVEWLMHRQFVSQQLSGTKSSLPKIVQSTVKEARLAELMAKQAEEKK